MSDSDKITGMFKNVQEAMNWLMYELPKTPKEVFKDSDSLKRGEVLMQKLGSPHLKLKAVHVAGTSGKGSTVSYAAAILNNQGFKVGLNLSPHAKKVNERIQINGQMISDYDLLSLISKVKVKIAEMAKSEVGRPSYFETLTAISFLYFVEQKVDYAVIEVGFGGLFDTTNLINPEGKICIINKIDIDHIAVLGDTVKKIAPHKAGIIQPGNQVIALRQKPVVNEIIKLKATEQKANLKLFNPSTIKDCNVLINGTEFSYEKHKLKLKMIGAHSAANFCLALEACQALASQDGWNFDFNKIRSAQNLQAPFRFEVIKFKDKRFIFDGAHNPDKIKAFSNTISTLKFNKNDTTLIFGSARSDQAEDIANVIRPLAKTFILSSFNYKSADMENSPVGFDKLETLLDRYENHIYNVNSPNEALKIAMRNSTKYVIVVGSFYLCDQVWQALKNYLK